MSNDDPDYTSGDLVFTVRELPHPLFTRKKSDLYLKLAIDLVEALRGYTRTFTHFDNHTIEIKAEEVTQPGSLKKVPFEGMPVHEAGSQKGDLYAEVKVRLPQILSESKKEGKSDALTFS